MKNLASSLTSRLLQPLVLMQSNNLDFPSDICSQDRFSSLVILEEMVDAPTVCSLRPSLVLTKPKVSSGVVRSVRAASRQPCMVKCQSSTYSFFFSLFMMCRAGLMSMKLGVLSSHSGLSSIRVGESGVSAIAPLPPLPSRSRSSCCCLKCSSQAARFFSCKILQDRLKASMASSGVFPSLTMAFLGTSQEMSSKSGSVSAVGSRSAISRGEVFLWDESATEREGIRGNEN